MIRGEKLAVGAAIATGALGVCTSAEAQTVTYQSLNYTVGPVDQAVTIGSNATPQYTYGLKPNPFTKSVDPALTPTAGSFVDYTTYSSPSVPTAGSTTGTASLKPDATTGADTYYHLQFAVNGATQYGYAQFSPDASILRGVGYSAVPAAPEPATWAELIVGFGLAGTALRRARRERNRAQPAAA